MSLVDLIDYYEDLADESERKNEAYRKGTKGGV